MHVHYHDSSLKVSTAITIVLISTTLASAGVMESLRPHVYKGSLNTIVVARYIMLRLGDGPNCLKTMHL